MSASDQAAVFHEAGLRVFPLNGFKGRGDDAVCDCGNPHCAAPGKHPRAASWQHTPEWDDDQFAAMTDAGFFASGYGVLCRGLLVIDVDVRNGGETGYAALVAAVPEIAGAGLVVQSGRGDGGRHLYFSLPEPVALVQTHPDYQGLDFKSSGYVVGPGSRHVAGGIYRAVIGGPDDMDAPPQALIDLLRRPERHRAEYDGNAVDVSHGDIADMLAHITPNCDYAQWIRIGMACHHATAGTGFTVWDAWSQGGEKYDAATMDSHWHSFGRSANPVTLGTLVHHAEHGGWVWPVTFEGADIPPVEDAAPDGLPFDITGIDLTQPPGAVGRVAAYIESKSRRPRRHLAVAGALMAVGCVTGLRYTDDIDGVTTNLMVFCVAGSRTGKEAIEQGVGDVIRTAGLADAISGKIKSEQEIIRNLTRHQCAFHIIDEIGLELQKLKNAAKGGTPYLEGIIGTLISVYGKSTGVLALTGDAKAEIRKELRSQLAAMLKRRDENDGGPDINRRIADLEAGIERSAVGLDRPFLSVIGFTTPVTFDALVDFHSATNGFIGRSVIFNERDTAPRTKPGWRRPVMPETLANMLRLISADGRADMLDARIENYGSLTVIPTDDRAAGMLSAAVGWFEDRAEEHKAVTGLEALYMGAYELVSKVSLILAVAEGVRTAEHVRWAFTLVRRDVEAKMRLVTANDRAKDNPLMALKARILNVIDGDDGETTGVIVNRCRGQKRADVEKALAELVAQGLASCGVVMGRKGMATNRYRIK